MKPAHEKYIPFVPLKMARRAWPDRELKAPPVWLLGGICGTATEGPH